MAVFDSFIFKCFGIIFCLILSATQGCVQDGLCHPVCLLTEHNLEIPAADYADHITQESLDTGESFSLKEAVDSSVPFIVDLSRASASEQEATASSSTPDVISPDIVVLRRSIPASDQSDEHEDPTDDFFADIIELTPCEPINSAPDVHGSPSTRDESADIVSSENSNTNPKTEQDLPQQPEIIALSVEAEGQQANSENQTEDNNTSANTDHIEMKSQEVTSHPLQEVCDSSLLSTFNTRPTSLVEDIDPAVTETDATAPETSLAHLSLDEWKKQKLAKHQQEQEERERTKQNELEQRRSSAVPPVATVSLDYEDTGTKTRFNYASFDAGAKVLAASEQAKGVYSILVEDLDKFVIQLSEDIMIDTIGLKNLEHYSSGVKDFQVLGSEKHPTKAWALLGNFRANNTREQSFAISDSSWVRYIKFRWLTHYGTSHFCTLTQIEVYGMTMLENLSEEMEKSSEEVSQFIESTTATDTPEINADDESFVKDIVDSQTQTTSQHVPVDEVSWPQDGWGVVLHDLLLVAPTCDESESTLFTNQMQYCQLDGFKWPHVLANECFIESHRAMHGDATIVAETETNTETNADQSLGMNNAYIPKENIFKTLTNRIKELEINQSLSNIYLREVSSLLSGLHAHIANISRQLSEYKDEASAVIALNSAMNASHRSYRLESELKLTRLKADLAATKDEIIFLQLAVVMGGLGILVVFNHRLLRLIWSASYSSAPDKSAYNPPLVLGTSYSDSDLYQSPTAEAITTDAIRSLSSPDLAGVYSQLDSIPPLEQVPMVKSPQETKVISLKNLVNEIPQQTFLDVPSPPKLQLSTAKSEKSFDFASSASISNKKAWKRRKRNTRNKTMFATTAGGSVKTKKSKKAKKHMRSHSTDDALALAHAVEESEKNRQFSFRNFILKQLHQA